MPFYVNEAKRQIEMVSVGGDGRLWIMTGPLGGEVRHTQEYETAGGGTGQLRFTRFNVGPDKTPHSRALRERRLDALGPEIYFFADPWYSSWPVMSDGRFML